MRARGLHLAGVATALGWFGAAGTGCTRPKPDEDPRAAIPAPPQPGASCDRAPRCGGASDATPAVSCCESLWVAPGSFAMGFSPDEVIYPDELREEDRDHTVAVSGHFLDRFEITWSRLEAYADQYAGPPASGSGAHPALPGSGWEPAWDGELPATGEELLARARAASGGATLAAATDALAPDAAATAPPDGDFAAGGLSWFSAFAFCIWDGARLPTEAEWEYAATGGALEARYPWGDDTAPVEELRSAPAAPVGSHPELRGAFGQDDLAGGVIEWTFDWFAERYYVEAGRGCVDCANTVESIARVVRGAADTTCCSGGLDTQYRAAARSGRAPGVVLPGVGARCARDPSASAP